MSAPQPDTPTLEWSGEIVQTATAAGRTFTVIPAYGIGGYFVSEKRTNETLGPFEYEWLAKGVAAQWLADLTRSSEEEA